MLTWTPLLPCARRAQECSPYPGPQPPLITPVVLVLVLFLFPHPNPFEEEEENEEEEEPHRCRVHGSNACANAKGHFPGSSNTFLRLQRNLRLLLLLYWMKPLITPDSKVRESGRGKTH